MSTEGRFVWYDLLTTDVDAAKAFYMDVVGWSLQRWDGGGKPYFMWVAGEAPIGGMMELTPQMRQAAAPPHWMAYVAVDDVDAAAARASELGGQIRLPGTDIPEIGRFAVITDPQGAAISLFRAAGEPMPAPDRMRTGVVGWHELNTTDQPGAWSFYSDLFGWRHASSFDMGEDGVYFMFRQADEPQDAAAGGMSEMAKRLNVPPHWLYYFNVADLDGALERVAAGGGQVQNGPMDVPGGGRIAQCMDPQGGAFALFEPAR